MCATDQKIRDKVKNIKKVFNRKGKTFDQEQAAEAVKFIVQWEEESGMTALSYEKDEKGKDKKDKDGNKIPTGRTKKEERNQAALLAINPPPNGEYPAWIQTESNLPPGRTPEAICQSHLGKVQRDLTSGAMLGELRTKSKSKPVTKRNSKGETVKHGRVLKDEGLDYALSRYMLTAGSDRECVKQKRTFEEGTQGVMLNNAEIQANVQAIKEGRGRIRMDGKQFHLEIKTEDKDGNEIWEQRALGSTENGGITWMSSHDASDTVEKQPTEEPQEESLLMHFLHGQQRLLEKLINQTT